MNVFIDHGLVLKAQKYKEKHESTKESQENVLPLRIKFRKMIVCIAEQPSVAKDIARIIGATKSHEGYMEGNGFQVTWTFGHLCTLKEPHDYTQAWK